MYIKMEIDSLDNFSAWSGGLDTLDSIRDAGKIEELDNLFQDFFCGETPTDTDVNDWLWFERNDIFDCLGMNEDEEALHDHVGHCASEYNKITEELDNE